VTVVRVPLPNCWLKVRLRRSLVTPILAAILLVSAPVYASARAYLPPPGEIYQGVTIQPISIYEHATHKHPAIYQVFSAWGQWLPAIFNDAQATRARLMIHISTDSGSSEAITPGQIARGNGDAWLMALNQEIASRHEITYVRLMAEMDNYRNPYSAFNGDGSRRSAEHSAAAYRAAWRRATLILRGGPRRSIDASLRALHLPALRGSGSLPRAPVAMAWVPMVAGAPDVAGNQPRDYFPGRQWVDWVGTDFYSKFPNFSGLTRFYNAFPGYPFAFGEWGVWGSDNPGFVDELFRWIGSRPRVRMLVYNQGYGDLAFGLNHYPAAAARVRAWMWGGRFPGYAPEWAPSH
jgi:hypothetical protein